MLSVKNFNGLPYILRYVFFQITPTVQSIRSDFKESFLSVSALRKVFMSMFCAFTTEIKTPSLWRHFAMGSWYVSVASITNLDSPDSF